MRATVVSVVVLSFLFLTDAVSIGPAHGDTVSECTGALLGIAVAPGVGVSTAASPETDPGTYCESAAAAASTPRCEWDFVANWGNTATRVTWSPVITCSGSIPANRPITVSYDYTVQAIDSNNHVATPSSVTSGCGMSQFDRTCLVQGGSWNCDTTTGVTTYLYFEGHVDSSGAGGGTFTDTTVCN